jgi:hypothetical protein
MGITKNRAIQVVVRAVGPRRMSGCGPGTRATCSAVLSGALEAYPPLGTTPGVLGGGGWWRVTAYLLPKIIVRMLASNNRMLVFCRKREAYVG